MRPFSVLFNNLEVLLVDPFTIEVNFDGIIAGCAGNGGDIQFTVVLIPHRGPGLCCCFAADQFTICVTNDIQNGDHVRGSVVLVSQPCYKRSLGADLVGVGVVLVGNAGVGPVVLGGTLTHLENDLIRGDEVTIKFGCLGSLISGFTTKDSCTALQLDADGICAVGHIRSDHNRVLIRANDLGLLAAVYSVDYEPLTVGLRNAVIPGEGQLLGIGMASDERIDCIASVMHGKGRDIVCALVHALMCDRVILEVASTNSRAIKLYESLGFIKTSEVSRWYKII